MKTRFYARALGFVFLSLCIPGLEWNHLDVIDYRCLRLAILMPVIRSLSMYKKLHTHEVSCPINVLSRNRSFVPGQYGPMEELLALRKNRGFSLTHGFVFLEELAVPDSP